MDRISNRSYQDLASSDCVQRGTVLARTSFARGTCGTCGTCGTSVALILARAGMAWLCHGHAMAMPFPHVPGPALPWPCHGMARPWPCHGMAMARHGHATAMPWPWPWPCHGHGHGHDHGHATAMPWPCHGKAMPWHGSGYDHNLILSWMSSSLGLKVPPIQKRAMEVRRLDSLPPCCERHPS